MMYVWVMSRFFACPSGVSPIAWSYGYNHSSMGSQPNGWGLVWISLDLQQLLFLKAKIDPNVEVVGTENSKPTPLLLDTYADKLVGGEPYTTLQQVLDKLGETEPRFILPRDPSRF